MIESSRKPDCLMKANSNLIIVYGHESQLAAKS